VKGVDSQTRSESKARLNITNRRRSNTPSYAQQWPLLAKIGNETGSDNQVSHCTNFCTRKRSRIAQPWIIEGDIARADIGDGYTAIVDARDVPLVEGRKWFPHYLNNSEIVYASCGRGVLMHRIISGAGESTVDHRDNDGLNNRRSNLRIATQSQNRANSRKLAPAKSQYKGVTSGPGGKWRVFVGTRSNRKYLGLFDDEIAAARAYDAEALKQFKEFARPNFPVAFSCPNSAGVKSPLQSAA
jgi:hypothetical protein